MPLLSCDIAHIKKERRPSEEDPLSHHNPEGGRGLLYVLARIRNSCEILNHVIILIHNECVDDID